MTRRCPGLRWPSLAARQAAPWRRKISATSSLGRDMAGVSVPLRLVHAKQLERSLDLPDRIECHPGIPCGRGYLAVTEQVLDHADVHALLQQMRRKAMP